MSEDLERTLVLVKPDGVQRGIVGEIIGRFEKVGLKIVGMKMVYVDEDFAKNHYFDVEERHGEKIYKSLLEYIISGPVVAMVLEGIDAVEVVRKMVGPTEPKQALPGTIRGDFAHVSYNYLDNVLAKKREKGTAIRNLIHASAKPDEAAKEIALWFSIEDIHSYKSAHDFHVLHDEFEEKKE
jgi:nucleoside-diphosphate kinase